MPERERKQKPAPKERVEETAEVAGISPRTVKREWRTAKAWLRRTMEGPAAAPAS